MTKFAIWVLALAVVVLPGCRSCGEIQADSEVIAQEALCVKAFHDDVLECVPECTGALTGSEAAIISCAIDCGSKLVSNTIPKCVAVITVIIANESHPDTVKVKSDIKERATLLKTIKRGI